MIVKASDSLRRAVFRPAEESRIVPLPGAVPQKTDLMHLVPMMPDWLTAMLADGSTLIVDGDDWRELPFEVKSHMEVLSW